MDEADERGADYFDACAALAEDTLVPTTFNMGVSGGAGPALRRGLCKGWCCATAASADWRPSQLVTGCETGAWHSCLGCMQALQPSVD